MDHEEVGEGEEDKKRNSRREGLENLQRQYEFLGKHLEYHDSNIFKTLTIYFGFMGLYLANLEQFTAFSRVSALLVLLVGVSVAILLHRTSTVLRYMKRTMRGIDDQRRVALGDDWSFVVISTSYLGESSGTFRSPRDYPTSVFGVYLVLTITLIVCAVTIMLGVPEASQGVTRLLAYP